MVGLLLIGWYDVVWCDVQCQCVSYRMVGHSYSDLAREKLRKGIDGSKRTMPGVGVATRHCRVPCLVLACLLAWCPHWIISCKRKPSKRFIGSLSFSAIESWCGGFQRIGIGRFLTPLFAEIDDIVGMVTCYLFIIRRDITLVVLTTVHHQHNSSDIIHC